MSVCVHARISAPPPAPTPLLSTQRVTCAGCQAEARTGAPDTGHRARGGREGADSCRQCGALCPPRAPPPPPAPQQRRPPGLPAPAPDAA
eukprot:564365-Rhodomonas_salina.1